MGCLSCKNCEFIRTSAFCGNTKLTQKQLYSKTGYCSHYEPKNTNNPEKSVTMDAGRVIRPLQAKLDEVKADGLNVMLCSTEIIEKVIDMLKEQEATQKGKWLESKCLDDCFWVCSVCSFSSEALAAPRLYKYCPNCGSKMESVVCDNVTEGR